MCSLLLEAKLGPNPPSLSFDRNLQVVHVVMTISCRSEIEECPDQDTSKMQAKLSIVPIDQLSLFIGKKVRSACLHM